MFGTKTTPARLARLGLAVAVAATGSITLFQGVSMAAAASYTAVPATGPATNAAYVITLTGTGFADAAGNSLVHAAATGVKFGASCGANEAGTTGSNATQFSVISATRLAVTTPSLTISSGTSLAQKVCVFDASTNLLGSATYTIYNAPTITAAVKPAAGPAFGGNTITVVGTNFTSKAKVTLGGVALTNVKVTGSTSLTATVPAHSASATALHVVVTTEGGPNPTPGTPAWDNYTYQNAISVSPTFGGTGTVLDVTGVGFSSLNWTNAKVYLVDGAYDPTDDTHGAKTHAQAGVCGSVQVISDSELVCTAPSLPNMAYTVTVVSDGAVDAQTGVGYTQTVVSSGSTFTYSPF